MRLSIILPFYDDLAEALRLLRAIYDSFIEPTEFEVVLVDLDASRHAESYSNALPGGCTLIRYQSFPGLARAKNKAIAASSGELVLFLYPGLLASKGAIERLMFQLDRHPELGAVAGRWINEEGQVEKGYNVRRFPTFASLMFDLLLINKLLWHNKVTRAYKMHDFDHRSTALVEHANDCVFMSRRELLRRFGGFNEKYFPGWFDQVELCQKMRQHGYAILYDPAAEFISNGRPPLINRFVHNCYYYPEFYATEYLYVKSHFRCWQAALFRLGLIIGMIERLLFSLGLPAFVRNHLLYRFRSYVGDDHIREMRAAYRSVLKASLLSIKMKS